MDNTITQSRGSRLLSTLAVVCTLAGICMATLAAIQAQDGRPAIPVATLLD